MGEDPEGKLEGDGRERRYEIILRMEMCISQP